MRVQPPVAGSCERMCGCPFRRHCTSCSTDFCKCVDKSYSNTSTPTTRTCQRINRRSYVTATCCTLLPYCSCKRIRVACLLVTNEQEGCYLSDSPTFVQHMMSVRSATSSALYPPQSGVLCIYGFRQPLRQCIHTSRQDVEQPQPGETLLCFLSIAWLRGIVCLSIAGLYRFAGSNPSQQLHSAGPTIWPLHSSKLSNCGQQSSCRPRPVGSVSALSLSHMAFRTANWDLATKGHFQHRRQSCN